MTINKLNGTECGTEIAKKINTIIDEKASVSLDNLDTDGQAILDGKVNSSDLFDANEHIKINKLQSYSLPSNSYISLTLGASGSTYTAPADGWFYASGTTKASNTVSEITLINNTKNIGSKIAYPTGPSAGQSLRTYLPVCKGDQTYFGYYSLNVDRFVFIYAAGSAPQS